MRPLLALAAGIAVLASPASAAVTFEIIGEGYATDVSDDGTVVVGNLQASYEPFRWTAATGVVPLGRSSVEVLRVGGGIPAVSADGTRVSSTILGADSTYATQGLWILGQGWLETMPPTPPDGGLMDLQYGSAWGLSGDGTTLVGLYWRPGQPGGSAHASAWTAATGVVDLGSSGGDSRANRANHDGAVVTGWSANPVSGDWRPAVWVAGELTILPCWRTCGPHPTRRAAPPRCRSRCRPMHEARSVSTTRADAWCVGWVRTGSRPVITRCTGTAATSAAGAWRLASTSLDWRRAARARSSSSTWCVELPPV
jgi:uncharacterized membrane protein